MSNESVLLSLLIIQEAYIKHEKTHILSFIHPMDYINNCYNIRYLYFPNVEAGGQSPDVYVGGQKPDPY